MNLYFICPKDYEPSNFNTVLELLKVKIVINLIPEETGINPEKYIDGDIFEDICYEDLSYIPTKPTYKYIPTVAHEICNYIIPDGYSDILGYFDEDSNMPFPQSKSNDFIANLKDLDDPNIMVFFNTKISDIARNIYKELFKNFQSREMEGRIPILLLRSWTSYPEGNIVNILRKMTKEEMHNTHWIINDHGTKQYKCYSELTPAEKHKFCGFTFNPLDLKEMRGKYSYYPQGDPLCYLYYAKRHPIIFNYDDLEVKIEMARQLFTKEALHIFNEKVEELEEERRQAEEERRLAELEDWLYRDDTDYDRETYYALGGEDYDRFREEGGNIDDMMDGLGF
jgi:hypothetical protein